MDEKLITIDTLSFRDSYLSSNESFLHSPMATDHGHINASVTFKDMERKYSHRNTLDLYKSALELNSEPVKITFNSITYKVGKSIILNNVTGYALPGHTHYIMGASGAGKTTLLNVIADRVPSSAKVEGKVLMNDSVSLLKSGNFWKYGAYVM
jgi:ABC-type transport system involved in cytochrome bd biosynthesis fused ATPase/permease subunit